MSKKVDKKIDKITDRKVNKTDEELLDRYGEMSEIEHILERSGLYVGNIHSEVGDYNIYDKTTNKIVTKKNMVYNEGLLKLFDEILTNSIDERIKSDRIFDINNIDVKVKSDGTFYVRDDGGIPVIKNSNGVWIPENLLGRLRTSSNYKGVREASGLNGLGAKLTNIFSSKFRVVTCDGRNKFIGEWSNNMRDFKLISIEKTTEHYTEIEFKVELFRFEIESIGKDLMKMFEKRCLDGSAVSPHLTINFEEIIIDKKGKEDSSKTKFYFDNFEQFVLMHIEAKELNYSELITFKNKDYEMFVLPSSETNIRKNYGFVNSSPCSKGTHLKKLENQISKHLINLLLIKDGVNLITSNDVMNRITIFMKAKITDPFYDSQSKDELKSKISASLYNIPLDVLDGLNDTEIYNELRDYFVTKQDAEKKKIRRKVNDELRQAKNSTKLINCKNKKGNEFFIFEGNSAQGGFKSVRDADYQMAYMLTGKVKNSFNLEEQDLTKSRELKEQIVALDLRLNSPNLNLKNCTADKIIFATDADFDGYHITGLLIVFYAIWFPELFHDNRIYRLLAPIGVATKGSGKDIEEHFFYTYDEYDNGKETLGKKGFTFMYKKGLGSLNDRHYERLIRHKKLERIVLSENYESVLRDWFASSSSRRKEIIMEGEMFQNVSET